MAQVTSTIDLVGALSELARRYQFRSRDAVCCYGLTVSQCYALESLARRGRMPTSELSEHLTLDLSSTTRVVDQIVKRKLATRRRGADDARVKEVEITEAGRRIIDRIDGDLAALLGEALADVPSQIRAAVPGVILRIAQALGGCCDLDSARKEELVQVGTNARGRS